MTFVSNLGPNPFIIDDSNADQLVQRSRDEGFGTGYEPRPYDDRPEGYFAPVFNSPIIPRSQWDDHIKRQEDEQSSPDHWRLRGGVPVLDQNGYGYCIPPGGLVLMGDYSLKPIEDVRVGDKVVSAEGNVRTVLANSRRYVNEDIYQLHAFGYRALECTGEHPLLTKRGYVPAKDIQNEDYLCFPKLPPCQKTLWLSTLDHVCVEVSQGAELVLVGNAGAHSRVGGTTGWDEEDGAYYLDARAASRVNEYVPLDRDAGRLFGLWLAEGSFDSDASTVLFSFSTEKESETLVPETIELVNKVFGLPAKAYPNKANATNIRVHSEVLCRVFEKLMGRYSWGKRIPAEFMQADREFKEGLISGWLDGDGCLVQGRRKGCTVSKELAIGLFMIANEIGMRPALQKEKPQVNKYAKSRRVAWKLLFSSQGDSYRVSDEDTRMWRKVRRVSGSKDKRGRDVKAATHTKSYSGFVHNLTIDTDESFIVDGCAVHNCWMYGVVGAIMTAYAQTGGFVPHLSASGPAFQGKNWRNQGGYGGEAIRYIERFGIPELSVWPEHKNDRSLPNKPEVRASAEKHKVIEFLELPRSNFNALMSVLLDPINPRPVSMALNWWGHLVYGVKAVKISAGRYGVKIVNSWKPSWGDQGTSVLAENKATAFEQIAIQRVKVRAA